MPQPGADDVARMDKLSPQEREAAIKSMVDRLADRLKASPDDLEGWRRLGRARSVLGDHVGAAEAWKQADRLKHDGILSRKNADVCRPRPVVASRLAQA